MQTEEVFRGANERIAEKGRELGWAFPVPFICECSDRGCFARLELTLAAYGQLRSQPQRYLTVPGHEVTGAIAIEQTGCYAFAEKLNARALRALSLAGAQESASQALRLSGAGLGQCPGMSLEAIPRRILAPRLRDRG